MGGAAGAPKEATTVEQAGQKQAEMVEGTDAKKNKVQKAVEDLKALKKEWGDEIEKKLNEFLSAKLKKTTTLADLEANLTAEKTEANAEAIEGPESAEYIEIVNTLDKGLEGTLTKVNDRMNVAKMIKKVSDPELQAHMTTYYEELEEKHMGKELDDITIENGPEKHMFDAHMRIMAKLSTTPKGAENATFNPNGVAYAHPTGNEVFIYWWDMVGGKPVLFDMGSVNKKVQYCEIGANKDAIGKDTWKYAKDEGYPSGMDEDRHQQMQKAAAAGPGFTEASKPENVAIGIRNQQLEQRLNLQRNYAANQAAAPYSTTLDGLRASVGGGRQAYARAASAMNSPTGWPEYVKGTTSFTAAAETFTVPRYGVDPKTIAAMATRPILTGPTAPGTAPEAPGAAPPGKPAAKPPETPAAKKAREAKEKTEEREKALERGREPLLVPADGIVRSGAKTLVGGGEKIAVGKVDQKRVDKASAKELRVNGYPIPVEFTRNFISWDGDEMLLGRNGLNNQKISLPVGSKVELDFEETIDGKKVISTIAFTIGEAPTMDTREHLYTSWNPSNDVLAVDNLPVPKDSTLQTLKKHPNTNIGAAIKGNQIYLTKNGTTTPYTAELKVQVKNSKYEVKNTDATPLPAGTYTYTLEITDDSGPGDSIVKTVERTLEIKETPAPAPETTELTNQLDATYKGKLENTDVTELGKIKDHAKLNATTSWRVLMEDPSNKGKWITSELLVVDGDTIKKKSGIEIPVGTLNYRIEARTTANNKTTTGPPQTLEVKEPQEAITEADIALDPPGQPTEIPAGLLVNRWTQIANLTKKRPAIKERKLVQATYVLNGKVRNLKAKHIKGLRTANHISAKNLSAIKDEIKPGETATLNLSIGGTNQAGKEMTPKILTLTLTNEEPKPIADEEFALDGLAYNAKHQAVANKQLGIDADTEDTPLGITFTNNPEPFTKRALDPAGKFKIDPKTNEVVLIKGQNLVIGNNNEITVTITRGRVTETKTIVINNAEAPKVTVQHSDVALDNPAHSTWAEGDIDATEGNVVIGRMKEFRKGITLNAATPNPRVLDGNGTDISAKCTYDTATRTISVIKGEFINKNAGPLDIEFKLDPDAAKFNVLIALNQNPAAPEMERVENQVLDHLIGASEQETRTLETELAAEVGEKVNIIEVDRKTGLIAVNNNGHTTQIIIDGNKYRIGKQPNAIFRDTNNPKQALLVAAWLNNLVSEIKKYPTSEVDGDRDEQDLGLIEWGYGTDLFDGKLLPLKNIDEQVDFIKLAKKLAGFIPVNERVEFGSNTIKRTGFFKPNAGSYTVTGHAAEVQVEEEVGLVYRWSPDGGQTWKKLETAGEGVGAIRFKPNEITGMDMNGTHKQIQIMAFDTSKSLNPTIQRVEIREKPKMSMVHWNNTFTIVHNTKIDATTKNGVTTEYKLAKEVKITGNLGVPDANGVPVFKPIENSSNFDVYVGEIKIGQIAVDYNTTEGFTIHTTNDEYEIKPNTANEIEIIKKKL
jgi:hypothetical protein